MKKIIFGVLLGSFLGAGFALAQDEALITLVKGDVKIIRGSEVMPATPAFSFQAGDRVQTGENCQVDVSLNGMAGCRLLAGSEIGLENISKDTMHLKITSGNAILNLDKLPAGSSFKVETPTAIAAVRGTQFWGRVEASLPDNPVTTFAVREGTVEIFAKIAEKTYTLNAGQALDIPSIETAVPVIRPALEGEMAAMAQADAIRTAA